ncbi:hypothetical protein [Paraburkholderia adhaesiva]|uniref:hypothetical protein n=1 Tax=Paraburkholderia adhaesiva TaxID=2883244 RepID=UPI001F20BEDC|nr:hypothetical protein [Paraburkholderia adhaesiva]
MYTTIQRDIDECGAPRVWVTGVDRETVFNTALDVKNATPPEQCPEVYGPKLDLDSGYWHAMVSVHKAAP